MKPGTLRVWSQVHTWSSLASTAFLLILCLTGLPLIFHDEIDALGKAHKIEQWDEAQLVPLDHAVDVALAKRPGEVPIYLSFDEDRPVVNITSGRSADVPEAEMGFQPIDRRGAVAAGGGQTGGVTDFLLDLHKDLLLGQGGMYFIGLVGLLFVAATVSGIVLYAPFARKAGFAKVRRAKAPRIGWLDWHNLVGGVTLAWALVVGLTGTINTLADPITAWWRADALAHLTSGEGGAVQPYRSGLVQKAVANAMARRRACARNSSRFRDRLFRAAITMRCSCKARRR